MVVPERILANTIFPFDINIQFNLQEPSRNMTIDMEINTPRGQSTTSSTNSSRATPVHSGVFSTACAEHIQALANNPTWADQVEISKSEEPTLFYVTPKVGETSTANEATTIENIPDPHGMVTNNMCEPQSLELSTILYSINQTMDLQFCSISIFGINKYLEGNAKNITCSLYRMAAFIRQQKLEDKTAKDIQ